MLPLLGKFKMTSKKSHLSLEYPCMRLTARLAFWILPMWKELKMVMETLLLLHIMLQSKPLSTII